MIEIGFGQITHITRKNDFDPNYSVRYSILGSKPSEDIETLLDAPINYIFVKGKFDEDKLKEMSEALEANLMDIPPPPKKRSTSQIIRIKLFKLWEKQGKPGDKEIFYQDWIKRHVENKIDYQLNQ